MKKLLVTYVIALSAIFLFTISIYANEIQVTVNGENVVFSDQNPVIVGGRTLVPIRDVFETMGFDIGWNNETRVVTLERDRDVVIVTIDSDTFTINGESFELDVPAQIIGGRTMLPLRAVLESVGYELDWDGAASTVIITASEMSGDDKNINANENGETDIITTRIGSVDFGFISVPGEWFVFVDDEKEQVEYEFIEFKNSDGVKITFANIGYTTMHVALVAQLAAIGRATHDPRVITSGIAITELGEFQAFIELPTFVSPDFFLFKWSFVDNDNVLRTIIIEGSGYAEEWFDVLEVVGATFSFGE